MQRHLMLDMEHDFGRLRGGVNFILYCCYASVGDFTYSSYSFHAFVLVCREGIAASKVYLQVLLAPFLVGTSGRQLRGIGNLELNSP